MLQTEAVGSCLILAISPSKAPTCLIVRHCFRCVSSHWVILASPERQILKNSVINPLEIESKNEHEHVLEPRVPRVRTLPEHGDFNVTLTDSAPCPFKAIMDTGLMRTTTGAQIFRVLKVCFIHPTVFIHTSGSSRS